MAAAWSSVWPRRSCRIAGCRSKKNRGLLSKYGKPHGSLAEELGGAASLKRELGIARCGLACCLCSENERCGGCLSDDCPDKEWCENRRCSLDKELPGCFACTEECRRGMLAKDKPYAFTLFVKRYGEPALLDCLEQNEKIGVVYHRAGICGDYDGFDDIEELFAFLKTGRRRPSAQ